MNELMKMRLFSLLSEPSQESTNEEMQSAYECFMKGIESVNQSDKNYSKIFRMLNTTRIELVAVQALHRYDQGKKCPKICLFAKDISSY